MGMNEEKQEACRKAWEYFQQNGITFNDILDCYLEERKLLTEGEKMMKVQAKFNSEWDGGDVISTDCMVDLESSAVEDIQTAESYNEYGEEVEILERESVTIPISKSKEIEVDVMKTENGYRISNEALSRIKDALYAQKRRKEFKSCEIL